jgi:hypothetical protein
LLLLLLDLFLHLLLLLIQQGMLLRFIRDA